MDAATTESGMFLVKWILPGGGGAALGFFIKCLFDHWQNGRKRNMEVTPQPLEVRQSVSYQKKEDFTEFVKQNTVEHAELYAIVRRHEREIGENATASRMIAKALERIERKVDNLGAKQ